jgi:predicted sugar kinase
MSTSPNRNITRNETKHDKGHGVVRGWTVRLHRAGKIFEQFFGDADGGKQAALMAARECRDAKEKEMPTYSRREIADIITRRNTSGVRGVRIRKSKRMLTDGEHIYLFAEASWSPRPNVVKKKSFSLDLYGEDEAWKMALKVRKDALRDLEA